MAAYSLSFVGDLGEAGTATPSRVRATTVLLVGTEPPGGPDLYEVLVRAGYRVLVARGPDAALPQLADADLVLAALLTPSDWTLCQTLKQRRPLLPVIALGARSDLGSVVQAFETGADDFIPLPLQPRELRLRIEARLRVRRTEEALVAAESQFRDLVEQSLAGIYVIQGDRFTYVNPRFAEIFGYSRGEIISSRTTADLVDPRDQDMVEKTIRLRLSGKATNLRYNFVGRRKNGTPVHVEVHGSRTEIGGRAAIIGTLLDVSQRRRVEEALRESELYFRSLIEDSQDLITVVNAEGVVLYESPSVERLMGHPTEELLGRNIFELVHREDADRLRSDFDRLLRTPGVAISTEGRFRHGQGEWRVLEASARNLLHDPAVAGVVVNSRDVTERKRAEQALRENEERFRLIVEGSKEVFFYIHDTEHRFEYLSPSVTDVLGYHAPELIGKPYDVLLTGDETDDVVHELTDECIRTGRRATSYTAVIRHRDGRAVTLELVESPLLRDGAVAGVQGFARDVTQRLLDAEALERAAFTDALTGLPNRLLFLERVGHAIARCRRQVEGSFALLFLDLDRFKVVNDSLGHEAGDRLLQTVAERLRCCLRPEDTIARFGGDEFAILVEEVQGGIDATRVANRIQQEISQPLDLDGYHAYTSASIGIVLGSSAYERPEHLLRNADMAMYRAKAEGGARHEIFDSEMHAQALTRLQLETELRRAVERAEFLLHYQPIVRLDGGAVLGFEALIRWAHPTRGTVDPADFISVAEETGLIVPIGEWVLETACRQLREWRALPGGESLFVTVNLSARQLSQPDLVRRLQNILRSAQLAPQALKLEITESVVVDNACGSTRALERIRALGVQLFMDDFGTGYSSLSYLHRLPLDGLKIDRSFVSQIDQGPRHSLLVDSVLTLARSLGVAAVAEGVETEEHARRLRELGCEIGQGFHFARPLDPRDARELLARAAPVPL